MSNQSNKDQITSGLRVLCSEKSVLMFLQVILVLGLAYIQVEQGTHNINTPQSWLEQFNTQTKE